MRNTESFFESFFLSPQSFIILHVLLSFKIISETSHSCKYDLELRDFYSVRKYTSQTVFPDRCRNNSLGIRLLMNNTEIAT